MILHRPPSRDGTTLGQRRREMVKAVVKHSMLSFVVVQIWIAALAFGLRFLAKQDKVMEFFGIRSTDHLGLWIHHHRGAAAYGIASAATLMAIVGAGSAAGLLFSLYATCRAFRARIERDIEVGEDMDRPQSGAADVVEENTFCSCDEFRFQCDRLCADTPRCEVPWADTLHQACHYATSCFHSSEAQDQAGMNEALSTGSGHLQDLDADGDGEVEAPEGTLTWVIVAVCAIIALVAIFGVVLLFIIAAMWIQKVVVKSLQLRELKRLTEEYEIQSLEGLCHADSLDSGESEGGLPCCLNGKTTGQKSINASLMHDLTYLYGYEVTPPNFITEKITRSLSSLGKSPGIRRARSFASALATSGSGSPPSSFQKLSSEGGRYAIRHSMSV